MCTQQATKSHNRKGHVSRNLHGEPAIFTKLMRQLGWKSQQRSKTPLPKQGGDRNREETAEERARKRKGWSPGTRISVRRKARGISDPVGSLLARFDF